MNELINQLLRHRTFFLICWTAICIKSTV